MPLYGGAAAPQRTTYLFVDGGSLFGHLAGVSRRYFGGKAFGINFAKLANGFNKVFYYDAVPVQQADEANEDYARRVAPKLAVLEAARGTDFVHVYEGDARRRRSKGGMEQKKVDVAIAVDMLSHAFRGRMTHATLLTGDADFKPLVDALVQEGLELTLWYPPGETNRELMNAADVRRPLSLQSLKDLVSDDLRDQFETPVPQNHEPRYEPSKDRVGTWQQDGLKHDLYREGAGYFTVTRQGDALNRLHVRHANFELLVEYVQEVLGIVVPPEVLAKAIPPI